MESTATKYKKIKGFANTKGQTFETKMVALLFLRGVNSGLSFRLGSNVAGAGALDDVVLQFKPRGQSTWVTCFVQMKHKETAWVTKRALTSGQGDFALVKYFEAYRDIKTAMSSPDKPPFFDGSIDETLLVLFTNSKASADLGEGQQVELGTAEEFLATGVGGVYAFDPDGNSPMDAAILDCLAGFHEEGKSFVKQLRVFCGQPSENGFDALIKDELRKIDNAAIKQIDIDRLCECFVDNVSVWCEKGNDVIYEGSNYLDTALDRVIVETCFAKERGADILDVSFTDAALSPLRSALEGDFSVLLVESSETSSCLSCSKCLQAIDGSHLFLGARCLLDNQKAVLSEWRRGKLRYVVISTRDCIPDNMANFIHIIKELCEKPSRPAKLKQVVLLSRKSIDFESALLKELDKRLTMFADSFDFSQLKDVSKENILQKIVSFQGHQTKLSNMLVEEQAANRSIDAPSLKEILQSEGELSVGAVVPLEVSYYVPRTLQRLHALKRSIFYVDNLAESITIVHSSEKDIVTFFWPREALGNPRSLQNALEKLAVFPTIFKEGEKVFVGETDSIGAYECNCLFLRSDTTENVTALRIRPNKGAPAGWFLFVKTGTSEADAAVLSEFNGSKHWLSLEEDLHWLKSSGSMEIIREHTDEARTELFSAENVTLFIDRLVLVCAEPGMGKSTLVSRLSKMTKDALPHFWVIAFALNDHSQLFSQGKHRDAFAFLSEVAGIKTEFEHAFFKFQLEVTGNVVVIVDGFDEIAPKYNEDCCTLITNLLKTNVKNVWVTSRNSAKPYLEDHLLTLAVKIRGFDDADQRCFLKQFWAKKSALTEKELDDFIDLLLTNMTRAISGDFLGIPLQMRIIAEVYEGNVTGLGVESVLPEKLDLLKLMDKFIEKKLQVYIHEKLNIQPSEPKYDSQLKSNRKEFIKNHSYAALTLIFSEDDIKKLHSRKILKKATEFFTEFASCQDNTGLIDSIVHGKPRFIHRVFAEYFVAKWFSEHLEENAVFLQTRLNLPDFSVIRTIFDLTLAKDCDLHTAVLNEDLEEVKALLTNGVDDNIKDLGGRTALHLGAAFGPTEDKTVHARREAILKELLASTKTFDTEDSIYEATPLRYADMTHSWIAIDRLLPYYKNADCKRHLEDTLRNVENRAMHLQICTHDLINLLNVCLSEGLSVDVQSTTNDARILRLIMAQNGSSQVAASLAGIHPSVGDFSLHNAANRGDLDTIKAILNMTPPNQLGSNRNTLKDVIDTADNAGWTALHHASFHGHVPVVDFLIDLGAKISGSDGTLGYTPLQMAAGLGRPSVVTVLLRAVKGKARLDCLKTGNKEGRTALHLAVETGHFDVVKILVEAADDVFQAQPSLIVEQELNSCDKSSLESAWDHVTNNVDDKIDSITVKVAGSTKAEYINTKDEMGRTALHDAAWHANTVILSYLITEGGDVWSVNTNNSTPLHWAAGCGDAKTVKLLIDAVDEGRRAEFANFRDKLGNTAMHDAIWEGRWESARLIIEAGGRVTGANDAGKTPLIVAAEKGHRDIVAKLLDGFVEREGIRKKDYIYMRDKDGRNVLDFASGDMVDTITRHISEVFDFDMD